MPPHHDVPACELAKLLTAARSGDSLAWSSLVHALDDMLRTVARSYRLSPHDVDDAVQATWVTLYEHVDRVRDSYAVGAWLATTVRRQSLRILQQRVRETVIGDVELFREPVCADPETRVLESERQRALIRALAALPDRQRRLMALIASEDGGSYKQMGAELDMQVGSIGPIRARCLARLQKDPELRAYVLAG